MNKKLKRRLTEAEIQTCRDWMERAPADHKPTIATFAKFFHVNKPSVIKSLEGWKGNKRHQVVQQRVRGVMLGDITSPALFTPELQGFEEAQS